MGKHLEQALPSVIDSIPQTVSVVYYLCFCGHPPVPNCKVVSLAAPNPKERVW